MGICFLEFNHSFILLGRFEIAVLQGSMRLLKSGSIGAILAEIGPSR
jgi:hypothetical protein